MKNIGLFLDSAKFNPVTRGGPISAADPSYRNSGDAHGWSVHRIWDVRTPGLLPIGRTYGQSCLLECYGPVNILPGSAPVTSPLYWSVGFILAVGGGASINAHAPSIAGGQQVSIRPLLIPIHPYTRMLSWAKRPCVFNGGGKESRCLTRLFWWWLILKTKKLEVSTSPILLSPNIVCQWRVGGSPYTLHSWLVLPIVAGLVDHCLMCMTSLGLSIYPYLHFLLGGLRRTSGL